MCGVLAVLNACGKRADLRALALRQAELLKHRGPDSYGVNIQKTIKGDQPLFSTDKSLCLCANGEIYNYKKLSSLYLSTVNFATSSDCEVIVHLYEKFGNDFVKYLDGMFSFVISDSRTGEYYAARDPIGITSFYYGYDKEGKMWFASELKALQDVCVKISEFPPGCYYSSVKGVFVPYFKPLWHSENFLPEPQELHLEVIREALTAAVKKRLMTSVPFGVLLWVCTVFFFLRSFVCVPGVLLSGGLDSSLIASIVSRFFKNDTAKLHTFSVGFPNSPDVKAAKVVADFLGTSHHSFQFSLQEGLEAVPAVIYHLESYDVTTVRASVPMFLMSQRIKTSGFKMVLSGEGSDEIFAGYLYFHKAPSKEELHKETVRKVKALHAYDCLRANKATLAWGLEARVPFLDTQFLEVCMSLDPAHKMVNPQEVDSEGRKKIEKYILRKAFDCPEQPYLPEEILWRQKEQFSDGVGYGWIDLLKEFAEKAITDRMLADAKLRFPFNTPLTKEAYYYRSEFERHFPEPQTAELVPGGPTVACSTSAAVEWDAVIYILSLTATRG
ncbi:hypothetical protein Zmor_011831 [Zophobas morio]|uniref:Asparagine synthetase [glutamine-hydrolyzing] n=1 Tax=Zophobas morio TaxID=2755281 RepID=A0AA38HH97_9CUCU|nr:hypothetical protein Zmor_011831 [Zophobas morio]